MLLKRERRVSVRAMGSLSVEEEAKTLFHQLEDQSMRRESTSEDPTVELKSVTGDTSGLRRRKSSTKSLVRLLSRGSGKNRMEEGNVEKESTRSSLSSKEEDMLRKRTRESRAKPWQVEKHNIRNKVKKTMIVASAWKLTKDLEGLRNDIDECRKTLLDADELLRAKTEEKSEGVGDFSTPKGRKSLPCLTFDRDLHGSSGKRRWAGVRTVLQLSRSRRLKTNSPLLNSPSNKKIVSPEPSRRYIPGVGKMWVYTHRGKVVQVIGKELPPELVMARGEDKGDNEMEQTCDAAGARRREEDQS
ncbi:hypothetical protein GUITHDRAFT_143247 [Guillardia theta CCMP2712]|uniref:Uncharacterized protein n=1 Tax=Guillardia theta (strain CCMP2712) TaxID=905079 RepID=L1IUH4_GUITC|nr:hypothetical protein GUITHDRAFT_143247 [Guillardia theta CCMP2712]EKX39873.1 hypothetical protein GUITHDRAFT_143247 [Guillardia theta CCMP2712]|eukprot:XP_005826853.1 hypothetical protein GUITHDRAFT_143247 [Guillardia theta CCMP2712]